MRSEINSVAIQNEASHFTPQVFEKTYHSLVVPDAL